ncbi:MAG: bile acid:sodium symporter family protein [Opitutales bacterium]
MKYLNNLYKSLSKFGIDYFIIALLLAITCAFFAPDLGRSKEGLSLSQVSNYLLVLIFFFYGLKLDISTIKKSLSNFKLHLLVQISTFIIFPALFFIYKYLFGNFYSESLEIGILFLCALPSTVSSSVVMVSIAKGNIPAAIFNASISGILGVLLTPLILSLSVEAKQDLSELLNIFISLIFQIILPVILGVSLNKYLFNFAKKHSTFFKLYDQCVIVMIVYSSFCDSFYMDMFAEISLTTLLSLIITLLLLLFTVYYIIKLIARLLHFSKQDTITATFCGSKKSLAHGVVMSKVIASSPALIATMLLPIMIFHALQLIVISIIAKKIGREG